jgi:peptide/nickel transport system permease protein
MSQSNELTDASPHLLFKIPKPSRRARMLIGMTLALAALALLVVTGLTLPEAGLTTNFSQQGKSPSLDHWFGTDHLGRDMFTRTVKGLVRSVGIGALASTVAALMALVLGILAATAGPKVDAVVTFAVDMCMSVPHIVLLILISFALGGGSRGVIVAVAVTHWPSLTRVIRAEVLQLRESEFVLMSKKLGRSAPWIAVNHMLPHVLPQFIVGLILLFPHAILHEASLTFLGFGLSPHEPAIGVILAESMRYLSLGYWWLAVIPGVALVIIVNIINSLGEGLRDLVDPNTVQE